MDILLATNDAYPELGPYDRAVVEELGKLGLKARPQRWDDPAAEWHKAGMVLIHSTWDYYLHFDKFLAWVDHVASATPIHNAPHLVRWNAHKSYLRELEAKGIAVTPTLWCRTAELTGITAEAQARGWEKVVVKPVVSAGAYGTYVIPREALAAETARLAQEAAVEEWMVQPYLHAFESEGERSYIFLNGEFSHAVARPPTLKSAIRGYDEPYHLPSPDAAEVALASQVIAAIDGSLLHARVDLAAGNDGVVRLQEVEIIEPVLFTRLVPGATARLAQHIAARL